MLVGLVRAHTATFKRFYPSQRTQEDNEHRRIILEATKDATYFSCLHLLVYHQERVVAN